MPYSIPASTKILVYILWQQHHFLILVGILCVCEFAMVPGVYILLCLLPTHSAAQSSKGLRTLSVTILLWQGHC